ncbi:glycosyl hydrolase [Pedobacter heparinus]|uniref:Glycoside hydrolase family 2 sugar binding n=1 Tax=Pedobacter heparinus (strain ATCC 13125 / DSM 2366 / CIP 104194 / JCM 7457 / NBRC 12017 / NCIMB 9290 / NRRL B-14731 / HIM 762-3) TaxID=485917 RepID=C6XVK2_PEDHD|nr:glycosyl hydrolase [Pedobacter heparinus]ACU06077.1 glycoside hydrolase family 2 sugar binding [Pedobacter heparinus DSM 2366]
MKLGRRNFIKISSIGALNLSLFSVDGLATIPDLSPLEKNFIHPPDASKSSCYWWWFNGLVDEAGITRDMEEFRAKGMGEVLLVNSAGGLGGVPYPQGAKFMSEEWKALYRHAMKEAKRVGIAVGINMSSGWCMGGPWIEPENSGRWYLQSELALSGPRKFSGTLPLPGNRVGYDKVFNPPGYKEYIDLPLEQLDYQDTAIVAIPDNGMPDMRISGTRAEVLAAKINHKDLSNFAKANEVMGPVRQAWENDPADQPVPVDQVINLTDKVGKDGHLDWEVPAGKWKIIRTGHRMTGSKLMIAQPEADGLSVDWFDRKGVEIQFEKLGKMFIEEAAKVGNKPKYFCDDSFEDGFPNWTAKIIEHFKHYRGYDPTPYLPALSGYLIGSAEIADRFLHDYRKTLADCMADEHYKRFAELCHGQGILVQNESAGPSRSGTICLDGLKNLGRSDFPMGEFWLGPKHEDESTLADDQSYGVSRLDYGQNKVTKMVASAAHIYGRETASAEAFTTMRHWLDYPGSLKQALDRAFCEGINRIAIHTSTASRPKDGKPGYEYGAGTHFNPNVTWWEKSGPFFDYVARSQYLLRSGKFVADVLYYNGDGAPNLVAQKHIDPLLGKGYDYDVCNEEVLLTRVSVKNGRITLPDGMNYRILVLPDTERMPLAVITKVSELVAAGATVVGHLPVKDSGLKNYPECDAKVQEIARELQGKVLAKAAIRNVLMNKGIKPDFEYTGNAGEHIDFIHRSTPEAEIYFITNRHGTSVSSTCTFRVKNRLPEIWDPVKGAVIKRVNFREAGDRVEIPLKFEAFQSWFIVFPKNSSSVKTTAANYPELTSGLELTGAWQVAFDENWGGPKAVEFASLLDWSQHADERIRYFSGKAVYTKTFSYDKPLSKDKPVYLDLGTVKNIAEVSLNGKNLGVVWTAPWHVDISPALKTGQNRLQIEVINLWPNRLIGDAALPKEKRITNTNIVFKKEDKLLSSGLLGPVIIKVTK